MDQHILTQIPSDDRKTLVAVDQQLLIKFPSGLEKTLLIRKCWSILSRVLQLREGVLIGRRWSTIGKVLQLLGERCLVEGVGPNLARFCNYPKGGIYSNVLVHN